MEKSESRLLREKIRVLERGLNLLNRNICESCKSITLPQRHAVIEIGRREKLMLKELSRILSLDTSTTSRMVDVLVKKNYVERKISSEDKRSIYISLTKEGEDLYNEIDEIIDYRFSEIFDLIPEEEKSNVLHVLDVIHSTVRASLDANS